MTERREYDLVIVGGGAAGTSAVQAAVERAPSISIALISDEDRLPYKRTKISKTFADGFEPNEWAVLPESWYAEHGVDLYLSSRAQAIDPGGQTLILGPAGARGGEPAGGAAPNAATGAGSSAARSTLAWKRLILATGAAPRQERADTPVAPRVFHACDIADIEGLREAALRGLERGAGRAVVVGNGVLGMEVAHDLHKLGCTVTVVGRDVQPLTRDLDERASNALREICEDQGIVFLPNNDAERVRAAKANADVAAVAIGVTARTGPAERADLKVSRAIEVDQYLRTSAPVVYAAGDCAQHPDGRVTHLWRDAMRQGEVAGVNAAAEIVERNAQLRPYHYRPFRLKTKIFGNHFFSLCRPAPEELDAFEERIYEDGPRYVHLYARDGRVRGAVVMNDRDNHDAYMESINERWPVERFEEEFGLRRAAV